MAVAAQKLGKNWPKAAKDALRAAYRKVDVPSDQLVEKLTDLEFLTELFNMSMGFAEPDKLTTKEVLHKLISLRKNRELPKLRMKAEVTGA